MPPSAGGSSGVCAERAAAGGPAVGCPGSVGPPVRGAAAAPSFPSWARVGGGGRPVRSGLPGVVSWCHGAATVYNLHPTVSFLAPWMSTRAVCRVLLLPPRRRGGMSRSETFDKVPMGTRQPPESLPVIHYPLRKPCFVSGPCERPGPSPAAPAQCTGRGCMPADLSGPAVAVGCGATARRVRGVLERRKRRPVACVSFVFQLGVPGILK